MSVSRHLRYCATAVTLLALVMALTAAAPPPVRPSDNGDYSWARQAILALYGRHPHGRAETKAVGDLAAKLGRKAAAEALMAGPEFSVHWSATLVDLLRVEREDEQSLDSCISNPLLTGEAGADLARFVRDNAPDAPFPGSAFNLHDVLLSSIALDDLSPFMRAYVLALASAPSFANEETEEARRNGIYVAFDAKVLGRNSICLACHNAAWSTTGIASGWNRTHPVLGYFERSLHRQHAGPKDPRSAAALFRGDGVLTTDVGPWTMADCGALKRPETDDPVLERARLTAYLGADLGMRASVFDLDLLFSTGVTGLRDGLDRSVSPQDEQGCQLCGSCPANAATTSPPVSVADLGNEVRDLFRAKGCFGCHGAGLGGLTMRDDDLWTAHLIRVSASAAPGKARVSPGKPGESFLMTALTPASGLSTSYPMPLGGAPLSEAERAKVGSWIAALPADAGCTTCGSASTGLICPAPQATVPANEALAYLVAMRLTDLVWSEVTGRSLTIAHAYPRNTAQRDQLWHLTENVFVAGGWSLKGLLAEILASDFFNRRPPSAGDGPGPYEMPMLFDPWVEQDPRDPDLPAGYDPAQHPHRHHNAVSEGVRRATARTMVRSAASALGWPGPRLTPSFEFPTRELMVELGQFMKSALPGFRGDNLDSFLAWESEVATCTKPEKFSDTDWIDVLDSEIAKANPAPSVAEVAETIKDRLLGDGRHVGAADAEAPLIAAAFGVPDAEQAFSETSSEARQAKLRRYCGTVLQAPQFRLVGLNREGVAPSQPRLHACIANRPCSYREHCQALLAAAPGRSTDLACEEDDLSGPAAVAFAPQRPEAAYDVPPELRSLAGKTVDQANGVGIIAGGTFKVLKPGDIFPDDAVLLAEPSANLVIAGESLDEIVRNFSNHAARRALRSPQAPKVGSLANEALAPGYATTATPEMALEEAVQDAMPYGSAGIPLPPGPQQTLDGGAALKRRMELVPKQPKLPPNFDPAAELRKP